MPTKVDGDVRRTLAHDDLRFFSDVYDAQIPGQTGYLGYPLQLCQDWTRSCLVRASKSMKDFPQVSGIPTAPRKNDGPWQSIKAGTKWDAPPICRWEAQGASPNASEAMRAAESCRGGLKRVGGGAPSFPHLHSPPLPHSALLRLLPSLPFPTSSAPHFRSPRKLSAHIL